MPKQLAFILISSFFLKLGYVFLLTDYSNYLFSDFLGYWERALTRFEGRHFELRQWDIFPTLPHIFLAKLFQIISFLRLDSYRLELVLAGNVFLSTFSVWLIYLITQQVFSKQSIAVLAATLYAFSFPFFYLNAFVMSEHPAVFLLILASYLVLRLGARFFGNALVGLTLGAAVCFRPAFGLLGAAFFGYILFGNSLSFKSIFRSLLFSCSFFLVIVLMVQENRRISEGLLNSFAANGGVNFYFAQCDTYQLISTYGEGRRRIVPPATVFQPEKGIFQTSEPIFNQRYFYSLGLECLKNDPRIWSRKLSRLQDLFFGHLLPSRFSAKGFGQVFPIYQYLYFLAAFLFPLCFILFFQREVPKSMITFLLSLPLMQLLTMYFFNTEHRYLYSMLFPLYPLYLGASFFIFKKSKPIRWILGLAVAASFYFGISKIFDPNKGPEVIEARVFDTDGEVLNLKTGRLLREYTEKSFSRILFPYSEEFDQFEAESFNISEKSFYAEMKTCMEVKQEGEFEFRVSSDDGFLLRLSGEKLLRADYLKAFDNVKSKRKRLSRGKHLLVLEYFQANGPQGLRAVYRPIEKQEKDYFPAKGLKYIGENSAEVVFTKPESCL